MTAPPPAESAASTTEDNANPPLAHELYPMADIRFVVLRIGELGAKVDRLILDVASQSRKVGEIQGKVNFVRGAVWVFGALFGLAVLIGGAYLSGKFRIVIL